MDPNNKTNKLIHFFEEKLLTENERNTNIYAAFFLFQFVLFPFVNKLLLIADYDESFQLLNDWGVHPLALLALLIDIAAVLCRFRADWLRYLLVGGICIGCNGIFFLFGNTAAYILFVPVIVSVRYFSRKFALGTVLADLVLFLLASYLRTYLDPSHPFVNSIHVSSNFNYWDYPREVLTYIVIPTCYVFLFVAHYAVSISISGRSLIKKRSKDSSRIATVDAELETAALIQTQALPEMEYSAGNVRISASLSPAKEVGGDFYDYFMVDSSTLIAVVADVSDKGVPSAMYMMSAKKAIRALVRTARSLKDVARYANDLLCEDNSTDMFITVWMCAININTGVGKYVNAGHNMPFIRHSDGSISKLENDPNIFMGAFPDREYNTIPFRLKTGDCLVLYTDGVTDSMNTASELFGEERLKNALKDWENDTPEDSALDCAGLKEHILSELAQFADGAEQYDDTTLMLLSLGKLTPPVECDFVCTGWEDQTSLMDKVTEELKGLSCPENVLGEICTAVDEVYSNICDYALEEGDSFSVSAKLGENFAAFIFTDSGPEFNPLLQEAPDISGEPLFGGLGIHLARNLSDSMEYSREDNKNVLRMRRIWKV